MTGQNISDYRLHKWIRTGMNEVTLLTEPIQVLENVDIQESVETENHIIVPFLVEPNKEAKACVLAKQLVCFEHDTLVSWVDTNMETVNRSAPPVPTGLLFGNMKNLPWIRTNHDTLHFTYGYYVATGLWEIEETYSEDSIDFDSKVVVDDIVILDNGLIMLFSVEAEVKTQVVTNIGWRSKKNLIFEPWNGTY